jgi:dihydrofolate reductase
MLSLYVACSQDFYIADANGSVDFLQPYQQWMEDYGYDAYIKTIDAIVMGRRTYDHILGFDMWWPYADTPTVVYTHRDLDSLTTDSISKQQWAIKSWLRNVEYQKMRLVWWAQMTVQALQEDILGEMILTIVPVKLHWGVHMFGGGVWPHEMRGWYKVGEQSFEHGVRQLIYKKSLA